MRLIVDRPTAVRHVAAALILCMAYFGVKLPAHADECAASAFIVSKTTLAEAREIWTTCNASIIGEGNLAIGGGSGKDGLSTVGLKQVLLVTVTGVDFEALPVARYAFVDEVLYAVTAELQSMPSKGSPFRQLTKDEVSELEQSLTRKYGKPRALKDMGAGKKPNIFIWDLRENELILTESLTYRLTLQNKALVKKVEAYKKAECKLHRPKGDGPITSVCL